ncbi:tape measure protein [Subdoligranulum variabile]|uniref:Tape measure domain protein n=1 Tax=Subdoligranulum variabile DSM 15176 TaxID=411471 RepID=D1PRF4_9FIRM|nr:tape measure protein [Subdoligranulum variabile]EFB74680.1 tape measure domain protein [Subdoligranulum variabile DSM 15176]UWP69414.1 tape measure protein [Subdoligranulum variabile]
MAYDGSITFDTQLDTSGFSSGTGDINKQFDTIRKGAESAASGMEQLPAAVDKTAESTRRLSDIVKGGGALKIIQKGVDAVTASLDSAINRYDTMNRFPMMMEQLGYGADSAQEAVQRLSEGIQGIPTTLDSVVSTAQRLTVLTGNLDGAVDTTLALNNAFLASGAGSDGAARGLEQYVQALSRGKFEMEEWKTMQETMGLALNRVAESFGYVGESAQTDLYNALKDGEITFTQFNDRIIQLNNGVGGFAELAKTSSAGIKTAWTNMGTAMVRGTTTMIEALDTGLSETKFKSIQNVIETTGDVIEDSMSLAAPAIEMVASHADILVVTLGALTVAYGANQVVKAFSTAQETAAAAIVAADAAGKVLTPTLNAKAVAEARAAAVAKLGTAATEEQIVAEMAANGVITAKTFALGGMTTGMGLATVASGLLTAATTALSVAIKTLLGPVGLITLGLTAVGAGAVAVYKAVTAESEAFTEQSAILDDLASTQDNLAKSEESNAKAADNNLKSIRANADAASELAKELGELDSIENKSASQKQRIGEMVDELNEKYADLSLTYDEEADLLSMNTEQLQAYIEAQQTMEEVAARQERYNELLDEEAAIRQNVAELETMQTEWAAQLEQKIISQGEYNELMQQSGETLAAYAAQEKALGDQRKALDEELAAIDTTTAQTIINNAQAQQEATQAAAEAEEAEMERRKEALQSYTETATNMFDVIDTKSELSVQQMIANMQKNQEILSAWADNLVALGERGLDQGLLQQLRDAGPESAATVAALVSATDEQLLTLSETFRAGGQAAANALQTELGLPEVTNAGSEMVTTMAEGVANNTALKDATTKMISEAQTAAKTQANTGGREIGLQMDNGITAGIVAGRSGVVNAMVETVREAIAAAAAEAEIHSPSHVMEDFIGLNLMKGWARGEEKGTDLVIEKAKAAMDKVQQAFANGSLAPTQIVATMRAMVAANQSRLAVPVGVAAGSAAPMPMAQTIINMNNTFNTHDSLSEAELTDETEAMAERLKWKIP